MSRRADRLFDIIQILRRARAPVTAEAMASRLDTSRRTIYRDIAVLLQRGIPIRGEAGTGYVLGRGYDLPPVALTPEETEAVVLGAQWVAAHADRALASAALNVLSKVSAMLPEAHLGLIDDPVVGTPPARLRRAGPGIDLASLKAWCRQGRKLSLRYRDGRGAESRRTVWPFLVGYLEDTMSIMAWCESRKDFRIFRLDRVRSLEFLEEGYTERPALLRRRWNALVAAKVPREP